MDYLTQHYKNLSEQLQAKVNHLNTLIRLSEENGDTIIKKKEEITKKEPNPKDYASNKDKEYKESPNKMSEGDKAKYAEAKEKSMQEAERKRQEEKPKPYTKKAPNEPTDVDNS